MKSSIEQRTSLSSRRSRFLDWSRNLLLIFGVLALGYVGFALLDAKLYQTFEARRFDQTLRTMGPSPDIGERLNRLPASTDGTDANDRRSESLGIVAPAAGSPLGRIEIDAIGLEVMILEGTDAGILWRAVGHVPGTSLPGQKGNVAIAGHRDTFFRPLRKIRKNDEITLKTLDGSYLYRVDLTRVVDPEDTYVLDDSNEAILTLVTCYPFNFVGSAPERFIVRAHRLPR